MDKKILVMNDLPGYGKVAFTAQPILISVIMYIIFLLRWYLIL